MYSTSCHMQRKVVVFGSSTVKEGSAEYYEAEIFGSLLAENNYGVVSGGYSGTMEAVSKGARKHSHPYVRKTVSPIYSDNRSKGS